MKEHMENFHRRISAARGDESRTLIANRAERLASDIWPDRGDLFIDEVHVRDLDTRSSSTPVHGDQYRVILAALGVPLVASLGDLLLWPDLRHVVSPSRSRAQAVVETLRLMGHREAKLVRTAGRELTITL